MVDVDVDASAGQRTQFPGAGPLAHEDALDGHLTMVGIDGGAVGAEIGELGQYVVGQ
ncbi:hypothetical protein [Streptomyces sp. CB03238]|uniref:hypothetical protein n=1 Tax=Streptomyces sp. CB03238 TaxID=1907777 RepID=UPI0015C47475|nr:hypothetical protein [Streptomyces sp. CB03238]